jgi:hypothetical protein
MRADKDSSGVALWVIPVGLAVVSLLWWNRLRDILWIPLPAADSRNGRRRSHCEAADVAL